MKILFIFLIEFETVNKWNRKPIFKPVSNPISL